MCMHASDCCFVLYLIPVSTRRSYVSSQDARRTHPTLETALDWLLQLYWIILPIVVRSPQPQPVYADLMWAFVHDDSAS